MNDKIKKIFKLVIVTIIVILSVIVLKKYSLKNIRYIILSYGIYAPVIYIAMFSILPIFLFPVPILALASGIVFGVFWGSIYTVIGATINSVIMYYLGGFLGRDYIHKMINEKLSDNMKEKLLSNSQKTLAGIFFMLRLIPLVSYNLINYISGITKINIGIYIATTIIGILPGTILFLNTGDKSLDFQSKDFMLSIMLLLALIVISSVALKIYIKKSKKDK